MTNLVTNIMLGFLTIGLGIAGAYGLSQVIPDDNILPECNCFIVGYYGHTPLAISLAMNLPLFGIFGLLAKWNWTRWMKKHGYSST